MDLESTAGLGPEGKATVPDRARLGRSILFKLAAMGLPIPDSSEEREVLQLGRDFFARYREQSRLLADHLAPADRRIQAFVDRQFAGLDLPERVRLPHTTLILDRHGLARELSFPMGKDEFHNQYVSSYRTGQGVLHNPTNDKRTTAGVFHVAEGGLPIPADKVAVPLRTFALLLREALSPPAELMRLPFATGWDAPVATMLSLLLRPLVCPAVPGVWPERRMEIRFFAPGGLASNLDFVESVFGNAGDPDLPENDAGLDVDHFTGHSGCVIVAPHLPRLRKRDVGLPHVDAASPAQRTSGMCWAREDELYNDGKPFKITARDIDGVMVTILADNYFGYCKKEVKTQISFAANLYGLAEEEHAGGTLAFAAWSIGDRFAPDTQFLPASEHRFSEVTQLLGEAITVDETGYATDRRFATIHYLPEDADIDLSRQDIRWVARGEQRHLRLLPGHVYLYPSGHKLRMEKHPAAPSWRLIRTAPEGTFCHKPCTVSGGGKSEISKSSVDAVLFGPIYVRNFAEDMALVDEIFTASYSDRFLPGRGKGKSTSRRVLSPERTLGSVIKLLTPNQTDFTPAYNEWLRRIPNHVRALVFIIKRFSLPDWQGDWRAHFGVDIVNGEPGHELKFNGRRLVGSYMRVGLQQDGAWRTFKLRQDFVAADKVQMEDDITASIVVPAAKLLGLPRSFDAHPSLKLAENCEWRLFQRPDDAVHPGFDKQTEADMAEPAVFTSNFQPLRPADRQEIVEDVSTFDAFTAPMQAHLARASAAGDAFTVCSARPRLVGGEPSKNPRYLQIRPDVSRPRDRYVAEMGARLARRLPLARPVIFPVASVLSGRRNNPPDGAIRALCVYNPIHYQELPELLMDYICSLTGKSPSTTGAGSEGALTKGPFNALCATADLNNMLVSMLLTGYGGFSTAAGWIGPHYRVDHDVSTLIPELWCRLAPQERDPEWLLEHGYLEPLADYELEDRPVLASRLGCRITAKFVRAFFGRVFDNPDAVFSDDILRPERQDPAVFADGIDNIVEAQRRVARAYFDDGSIDNACPPVRALLHIMAYGHFEGMDAHHPALRAMFTRESLLGSDWYRDRLAHKQQRDIALWQRHVRNLSDFLALPTHRDEAARLGIAARLDHARTELARVRSRAYLGELHGTIGADAIHRGRSHAAEIAPDDNTLEGGTVEPLFAVKG